MSLPRLSDVFPRPNELKVSVLYFMLAMSFTVSQGNTGHNSESSSSSSSRAENSTEEVEHGAVVHVASVHYVQIRDPLIFTCVVLITALCKVAYHHFHFLSSKVPESCILVLLGVGFGAIIEFSGANHNLPTFFSPHQFFLFLLPPITLEAAYSLHDRTLLENIGTILLFAIVGTVAACFLIGLSMYGLANVGAMGSIVNMSLLEYMVFAALIVAVDPVAVLAVFSEIGVNNVLYFIVFGESLLNDGVTVVLYSVFQELKAMDEIGTTDILLGLARFVVVCLGGLGFGVLAGLLTALITKYTTHVKVVEPIIIFSVAYFGFLLSELFTFSGIISMIGCGLTQKQYAFNNISDRAKSSVNYFSKVISNINEIIIFLFLGIAIMSSDLEWHTGFSLWAIGLCLVFRFFITYLICFLVNRKGHVRKITFPEQFMIAYGGLRGAVCFSLVALLEAKEFPQKNMFVTSSFAVILFTVFLQGITIKPLVFRLRISLTEEKDDDTLFEELNHHVTDQVMTVLEKIIGDHGHHHFRERLRDFDAKYLKRFLLVKTKRRNALLHAFYENLLLREHFKHLELSGVKTEKPKQLNHIDTELLLSTLDYNDSAEGDEISTTESNSSTDLDIQSQGSSDKPSAHDHGLFFTAPAQHDHHRHHHSNNHHHHHLHHDHHNRQLHGDSAHHNKAILNAFRRHSLERNDSARRKSKGEDNEHYNDTDGENEKKNIDAIIDVEKKVAPHRRPRSMSTSHSDQVRTQDLRDILSRNQMNNMNALKARIDPDMSHHVNLPAEIKNKSHTNRRLSVVSGNLETSEGHGHGELRRRRGTIAVGIAPANQSERYLNQLGSAHAQPTGNALNSKNGEQSKSKFPGFHRGNSLDSPLASLVEEEDRSPASTSTSFYAEIDPTNENLTFDGPKREEEARLTSSDKLQLSGVDNPAFSEFSCGDQARIDASLPSQDRMLSTVSNAETGSESERRVSQSSSYDVTRL